MTFGFYLRDVEDFYEWRSELYRLREYFNSDQLIFNLQGIKQEDSDFQYNIDQQDSCAVIQTQPSPSRDDGGYFEEEYYKDDPVRSNSSF